MVKTPADYSFAQSVDYNLSMARLVFWLMNGTQTIFGLCWLICCLAFGWSRGTKLRGSATWCCSLIQISTQFWTHISGHFGFTVTETVVAPLIWCGTRKKIYCCPCSAQLFFLFVFVFTKEHWALSMKSCSTLLHLVCLYIVSCVTKKK